LTDFGGKTSIFSHPVYLFLREFSLQDFRGGSDDFLTRGLGVTNGAIVIHTQRLKSDPGGNLLS
ncbi:hypothetical protein, partial [Escherichia coli]|uniref:hypothetical protein n=1 Tax=Escherichia coli TaxID=562 RepID=UPI0019810013